MAIPMVLERSGCAYECLNCHACFQDDHGWAIYGWSWCPVCGVKWQGAMLFRHKKWRRFYDKHGIKEKDAEIRGWMVEKRWHDWDGEVRRWEEASCSWQINDRKTILEIYREETRPDNRPHIDKNGHKSLWWEYRIVRKTMHVRWSEYWSKKVNGE